MLLAVCKATGKEYDCIPRIASGFGGGVGRQGEVCGALTGLVMLTGLFHGRDRVEEREAKEVVHAKAGELVRQFATVNGAVRCRDLLGLDVSTREGVQAYHARNLLEEKCSLVVRKAVRSLMEE